ncbi:MAG TPA: type II toxin-antitoxin system RelE/ParE family toxin [Bacteroidetes bacterium]|nr:type II toxin-antitoxin system RelE/ParE family toxin [Bacteroidota bacterium]
MAYNIELFKAAEKDFDEAVDWYATQSIPTARKFGDAFQKIVKRLSDNPFQFPIAGDEA